MSAHPDPELLTAFADGELVGAEAAHVSAHLEDCDACVAALAAERATAQLLRGLASAEPPADFLARVASRGPVPPSQLRRHVRFAVANVAAAAAVWIGVVGVARITTGDERIRPELDALVGAHSANAVIGTNRIAVRTTDAVPSTLLGGYQLVETSVVDGRREALYSDGEAWVSMFVEPGRLDTDTLPADARPVTVDGRRGWAMRVGSDEIVIVERDGTVVMLVGDASEQLMTGATGEAPSPSVRQRVAASARGVIDSFGFG